MTRPRLLSLSPGTHVIRVLDDDGVSRDISITPLEMQTLLRDLADMLWRDFNLTPAKRKS